MNDNWWWDQVRKSGGLARDMSVRDVVAMFFMLQYATNGETSLQEDASNAFLAADIFIKEGGRYAKD
jgi:hypothetical protein